LKCCAVSGVALIMAYQGLAGNPRRKIR